ncbi:CDP-alcohol phosphatidyltransferase family protein [Emergencia timonensis]|nr:CDP-alcohol phosphatidyltransferase family protein [Emergencia timonensis]WNX87347.1 CDP-alcohol phosphatidyltransferase family protein [Emergencia timonensis]
MFDGKVARRKKDRTDNEKLFGIQLDSLCDVVAFGAFPSLLCYCMGVKGSLGMLAIGFYCICGVIRLAYFNVVETNNFFSEEEHEKVYHGLPITSIAVILPVLYLLHFVLPYTFPVLLMVMLFAVGTLFIADFKMKKPSNKVLALIVAVVAIAIIITFVYSRYKLMNGFVL